MTVDPYLIPGTATLRNLHDITDPDELRRVEEDVSAFGLRQLVDALPAPVVVCDATRRLPIRAMR